MDWSRIWKSRKKKEADEIYGTVKSAFETAIIFSTSADLRATASPGRWGTATAIGGSPQARREAVQLTPRRAAHRHAGEILSA